MKSHLLRDHDGILGDTESWYFEATRQCITALGVTLPLRLDALHEPGRVFELGAAEETERCDPWCPLSIRACDF